MGEATEKIMSYMQETEMLSWVAGSKKSNPRLTMAEAIGCIEDNPAINDTDNILDFGYGLGVATAGLLAKNTNQNITGLDIIPQHIEFCRKHIQSNYVNTRFYCTSDSNALYEHLKADAGQLSHSDEFFATHRGRFDVIVCFSVFTHFTPDMARHYLEKLRDSLSGNGCILASFFLNDPRNPLGTGFGESGDFPDADPTAELSRAVFSLPYLRKIAAELDLVIRRVSFGSWRGFKTGGRLKGTPPQDILIFEKSYATLPDDFDADVYYRFHPDVKAAGARAHEHYIQHGYFERRPYR